MSFGVTLLQKGKPRLLGMLTLGKVKGATIGLIDSSVGLLRISALEFIKEHPIKMTLLIIGLRKIQLPGGVNQVRLVSRVAGGCWLTKSSTISENHSPSRWKTKPYTPTS